MNRIEWIIDNLRKMEKEGRSKDIKLVADLINYIQSTNKLIDCDVSNSLKYFVLKNKNEITPEEREKIIEVANFIKEKER